MKKSQSILILVFAVVFLVMIVGPALLNQQFRPYPLIKNGDVLDIFTPLIIIPIYWLLFTLGNKENPNTKETLAFLILASFWVEGQGMHLSANSIGHLLKGVTHQDLHTLTYFFDENLSHYLWHFGMVGLSALLIYRHWRMPSIEKTGAWWAVILGGIIHGFNYFISIVEAQTAILGVPFAILTTLFMAIYGRKKLKQRPLLTFFFIAYLVATLFFTGWAIYWGGLPEFSAVGIID
jgi:hypothetical protein